MQIVGVKFDYSETTEYFDAGNLNIKLYDKVLCNTENGLCLGTVNSTNLKVDEVEQKVVRIATQKDLNEYEKIVEKQNNVLCEIKKTVKQYGIDMNLVSVYYTFDMSKLIISFTAEGRVDFRDLVKGLVNEYKTRIELRQIGVRDKAKLLGGYGMCGRALCCSKYLKDFGKVSLKMAKNQGLSLNPNGITGSCGRLMCCLQYEDEQYLSALANMPKLNSKVKTPDGEGVVTFNDVLKNEVTVKFVDEDGTYTMRDYALSEIIFNKNEGNKNQNEQN